MKTIALIPARLGSKGIIRKNIKLFCGKPLIAWTIECALSSSHIDKVIVSTDSIEIAEISKAFGADVPFLRPSSLATDESTRNEVILHALENLPGFDQVLLLQPTSPLRQVSDIDQSLKKFMSTNAESCVSVEEATKPPEWMFRSTGGVFLERIIEERMYLRRQDAMKTYILNGAIFLTSVQHFIGSKEKDPLLTKKTTFHIMESISSFDIDSPLDWYLAEYLMKNRLTSDQSS